jgi:hypothetical protein
MRRLGIEPGRDVRTDELLLDSEHEQLLWGEFEHLRRLGERSTRLRDAAGALGIGLGDVKRLIGEGALVEDPERDAFDARYVPCESVTALAGQGGDDFRHGATPCSAWTRLSP